MSLQARKPLIKNVGKLENLKQINLNAAGIDIGSAEIYICVPEDRDQESVRAFKSFTRDLHEIADWLKQCHVDTVAMESTGVYWIPLYEILEERGFEVLLVNARHIKNVTGRKTDILDCQWIQQLHTYGLLRGSFRPSAEICELRSHVRHREKLTGSRASYILYMQKALHLMNLQLDNVISDITGLTGMRIIRAIVDGQRSPKTLARYRDSRCKNSEETIEKSLEGNYKPEHLFQLKQALALYDYYTTLIHDCDHEINKIYDRLGKLNPEEKPIPERKGRSSKCSKNEPEFDLRMALYRMCGVDLTNIDGLNPLTVQMIISEIGTEVRKWPTVKHFTSWLSVCPQPQISGGKTLKDRTKKTTNRAYLALRLAAMSLHHSDSALGAFYRRKRAHLGAPKAITAAAHKIARIIYFMLYNQVEYVDQGADYYEQKYRERELKKLRKKAEKFGYQLILQSV